MLSFNIFTFILTINIKVSQSRIAWEKPHTNLGIQFIIGITYTIIYWICNSNNYKLCPQISYCM